MASIRLRRTNEDGSKVYQIRASRSRNSSQKSITWTAPAGWSQKAIESKLSKIASDLDRGVKDGTILTRKEQKAREKAAAEEEARIKTVAQYGEDIYLPFKRNNCAPRTAEYYGDVLQRYIYPSIGTIKIADVQPVNCKKIIQDAQDKGLSHSTTRGIYLTLSQLFDQAVEDKMIDVNPVSKKYAPHRRKDDEKKEIGKYTDAELNIIRECLEHESLKWRAFFHLMMDTGARKGELCGLKWQNIDFSKSRVKICTNAVKVRCANGSGYDVKVTTTKNGKHRYVPIATKTLQLLLDLKDKFESYDFVFVQCDLGGHYFNKPMMPNSVDYFLRKFAKRYNIEFKCHPHKFRHTVASNLLQMGFPIQDVAYLLGDNPETITRFYIHPAEDIVERYQAVLDGTGREAITQATRRPHGNEKWPHIVANSQ